LADVGTVGTVVEERAFRLALRRKYKGAFAPGSWKGSSRQYLDGVGKDKGSLQIIAGPGGGNNVVP
jgi:hypothetical protein